MNYEQEIFSNYQALAAKHPNTAAALLYEFGEGEWQNSELYWYPTEEDFAMYEVEEGWYSNFQLNQSIDFNGAPNLLNFLDFKSLGSALVDTWDNSCHFEANNGEIVSTGVGFYA